MKRLIFIVLLVISAVQLKAQSRMSSADISYLYNRNHEFLIDYRVAQQGDRVKVYVRFVLNSGIVKISDYEMRYDIRSSYIDEKKVNGVYRLDSSNIVGSGFREFIYAFEFLKTEDRNLVVLEVNNLAREKNFMLDIPIGTKKGIQQQPFLLFEAKRDVPFFSRYIRLDQSIRIVNPFGTSGRYEIKGYENNNAIALPPFDDGQHENPSKVAIDTLYGATEGELFQFSTPGFYLINEASDPYNTLGIFVSDDYYPYYSQYEKMIQPLIFISTNDEFKAMRQASDSRAGFEEFVLSRMSGNSKIAQDFIKYYYGRIRKSAHFFTTDKEGWKTDRGMVYQIFGNPLQVFRNENTELWVYASLNGGRIRFIFDALPSQGNMLKYQLIRADKYKDSWMDAVTNWRSGKIIE